jgi:hypothetical protein
MPKHKKTVLNPPPASLTALSYKMSSQSKRIAAVFASLYDNEEQQPTQQPTQQQQEQANAAPPSNLPLEADITNAEKWENYDNGLKDGGGLTPERYPQGPVPFDPTPDARFPSTAPKGFPRIISSNFFDEHDPSNITVADSIATFLYR